MKNKQTFSCKGIGAINATSFYVTVEINAQEDMLESNVQLKFQTSSNGDVETIIGFPYEHSSNFTKMIEVLTKARDFLKEKEDAFEALNR